MAQWKIELKVLARDFCIPMSRVNHILKDIEDKYSNAPIPYYYHGERENIFTIEHGQS